MQYVRQGDTYILRFEDEEPFPTRFLEFLAAESIAAGSFTGIGAMLRSTIAFFDVEAKRYLDIELEEQLEVLALVGNVALHQGDPLVHAHALLGRRDGSTLGGHLRQGIVRPTLELTLRTYPEPLQRSLDPAFGLPALKLANTF
jgi:predicted DNA-binding protein with PD1-like motif